MILTVLEKHMNLETHKVFFFGSRVDGTSNERSDVDIGIEGEKALSGSTLAEIRNEIEELPILYSIDIIDFRKCSEDFRKVASAHTEPLTPMK